MCCRARQYSSQKTLDEFLEVIQVAVGVELEWLTVFSRQNLCKTLIISSLLHNQAQYTNRRHKSTLANGSTQRAKNETEQ